jgi:hypothetical protein
LGGGFAKKLSCLIKPQVLKLMAKVIADQKIQGTVYNRTYKAYSGNKEVVGDKSLLNKERVNTDSKFANTRRNNAEFVAAQKSAVALRKILYGTPDFHRDNRLSGRMLKLMIKMLREDTTNIWGERVPVNGDFINLVDFDYNIHAPLTAVMKAPFTSTLDRAAGTATIGIPSLTPSEGLVPPTGIVGTDSLYFRFFFVGAEIDFTDYSIGTPDVEMSAFIAYDDMATAPISQVLTVTAGTVLPVFGILGVEWALSVGGDYVPLRNIGSNPMRIVLADKV